jgi:O-antigen/teichoic acid export membrane protein
VALVSIVVHFFDVLSNVGSEQYIIQKQSVSETELNTAWTMDLCMKSGLWVALMAGAVPLAIFFERPPLAPALWVGASVLIINACANPGLFLLKQSLAYGRIFWLSLVQRVVTFVIVVVLALQLQSFWALIAGDVASSLLYVAGSYLICAHRPALSREHWTEQWSFSGWMLLRGVVGYARSALDTVFVSKLFGTTQLGHYTMARDVAMLPAHNLIVPASEPLLAVFGKARQAPGGLRESINLSLALVALAVVPLTVCLSVFSDGIALLLLGPQWTEAGALLAVLTLLLFYFSFITIYEKALIADARTRLLFVLEALSLLIIAVGLYAARELVLLDLALARGILGILNLGLFAIVCGRVFDIRMTGLFAAIAMPALLSVIAMGVTLGLLGTPAVMISVLVQQLAAFTVLYGSMICVAIWSGKGASFSAIKGFGVRRYIAVKMLSVQK